MPENPKLLKIGILGVPNSGKSTIVNRLMNRKVIILRKKNIVINYFFKDKFSFESN